MKKTKVENLNTLPKRIINSLTVFGVLYFLLAYLVSIENKTPGLHSLRVIVGLIAFALILHITILCLLYVYYTKKAEKKEIDQMIYGTP